MSIDAHAMSGAYALGALSPEEAAEFQQHLEGCATCRAEVAEFREVAARLGESAAETPPASLRERVLSGADRVRQDAPIAIPIATRRAGSTRSAGSAGRPGSTVSRGRRWAAGLAAAALVGIAGVLGFQALDDSETSAPLAAPAAQVFDASDAETVAVPTSNGGTLRVAVSPGLDEMAVDLRELPELGSKKIYQLWTGHEGRLTSVGTLAVADTGTSMPMPPGGDIVAITIEPSGGSEQPSAAPIATVEPTTI